MRHASLFSGIGGFDLAASMMGWQNIFYCENDEFCRQILKYHFPKSIAYGDIKTTDFRVNGGQIDILTGGFPCQPFSDAGLKGGTNDPRYLWPEMYRAIREIRPRWVVAENVRGLISWNGGLVFDTVCTDLENEGYEVLPFILPACGVNAPHQRYRVWFIAYATSDRLQKRPAQPSTISREVIGFAKFPYQSPIFGGNDGIPDALDGITFPKWRDQSIKGYGNAIVPQVAMQIFKTIIAFENIQL